MQQQKRMQVSSEYERDEALYREIINFVGGKPHNLKPGSPDLIKAEIADRYVMKFPDLGLEENKDALKLLLDIKYEEVESTILRERDVTSELNVLEQKDQLRAHAKLVELGVFPASNDDFY
jgi:hypothetical protein